MKKLSINKMILYHEDRDTARNLTRFEGNQVFVDLKVAYDTVNHMDWS